MMIVKEKSASHGEPMTKHEMREACKHWQASEMRLILRGLRFDTARREENADLRSMISFELKRRQCRMPSQ